MDTHRSRSAVALLLFLGRLHAERRAARRARAVLDPAARRALLAATAVVGVVCVFAGGLLAGSLL